MDAVDQPPILGGSGAKGLFWILDEEAASPGASDESFVERLLLHYGKAQTACGKYVVFAKLVKRNGFIVHDNYHSLTRFEGEKVI